jgi:outer membrane protein assembly factor BamD
MMQSSAFSSFQIFSRKAGSFSPDSIFSSRLRVTLAGGLAVSALLVASMGARAQEVPSAVAAQSAATPAATGATPDIVLSNQKAAKQRKQKEEKIVESKATKKEDQKIKKDNPLAGQDAKLPDKSLYDKAEDAVKHGRYDVARLDLQTLLNTYPDSQYMMRAKLAIADSWFKEGGAAALTQAEQEYKDFITFFPNAPEAAEAQMRVGDIYFRQMDKPDRDYSNTTHAEEEYRLMIQQFPDSTLVPQAKQRLREVQETLASRESDVANFYASHANWSAAIARDQTVVDTYPLYSHLDDVLVNLGDAYEAEARNIRSSKLPEAAKARLLTIDDGAAAAAYRKVVLEHSAAPHVEDARDRLVGMGLSIPTPTPEQAAASAALENSRGQYTLSNRVEFFVLHKADTVPAATIGDPPLEDAKPTLAPTIYRKSMNDFAVSLNPATSTQEHTATPPANAAVEAGNTVAPATAPVAAAPLALQDVTTTDAGQGEGSTSAVTSVQEATPAATGGTSVGIEIVQPSAGTQIPANSPSTTTFPGDAAKADAATPEIATPAQTKDVHDGLMPKDETSSKPLPPIEKPDVAPDAINEVAPGSHPPAQLSPVDGKQTKAVIDKADDSSSKNKKKKGLSKLNPF